MAMVFIKRKDAAGLGKTRYYTGLPCPRGHVCERWVASFKCVECARIYERDIRNPRRHPKKYRPPRLSDREYRRRYKQRRPESFLVYQAKARAARFGSEFLISITDVKIPEACPCCGAALSRTGSGVKGRPSPNSPTIDRVDNSRGYFVDNIAVICWRCNRIKGAATAQELRMVADWIERTC